MVVELMVMWMMRMRIMVMMMRRRRKRRGITIEIMLIMITADYVLGILEKKWEAKMRILFTQREREIKSILITAVMPDVR